MARVEDVHEIAGGMPHVTVEADGRVYQVGGKSLQLLAEVRDTTSQPTPPASSS